MESKWVLGIDGGGTKTDAILVSTDGTVAAEESAGASNVSTVGVERAAEITFELLQKCCQKVSCGPDDLYAVGVGLAGAGLNADRVDLHRYLIELGRQRGFPLSIIVVETDWRIALEAAFPASAGIVLIAGTGSIACAKGEEGKLFRVGGWGWAIGDEGSGHALGRDALNAALRAFDGRGDRTLLLDYAFGHFAASSVDELISRVYREGMEIALFAPKLFEAEGRRDQVSHSILFRGAHELTELVRALTLLMRPKRRLPLALLGGLLDNQNVYANMVKEKILSTLPQIIIQKPKFPPAFGAAIMAFQPFRFPQ